MGVPLLTPNFITPIYFTMDVVAADFFALPGLDILGMRSLVPDTLINCLKKREIIQSDRGKFKNVLMTGLCLISSRGSHLCSDEFGHHYLLCTLTAIKNSSPVLIRIA